MNLSTAQGDLILMIIHPSLSWGWPQEKETVEEIYQRNKEETAPWELYCNIMNTCVMKCSLQNLFPWRMHKTREEKSAP